MSKTNSQTEKASTPAVYSLSRPSRCYGCDRRLLAGEIVKLEAGNEDKEVFCSKCAMLDMLEILPSGNAKITRLAKKYSKNQFVILRWSDLWKTYERVGLLVESQAIDRAQDETGEQLKNRNSLS
jgi:hypothetical protein